MKSIVGAVDNVDKFVNKLNKGYVLMWIPWKLGEYLYGKRENCVLEIVLKGGGL